MERNRKIDFYRLLFAGIILIHHSHGLNPPDPVRYPFCGGYLAVEFFLMLSGFFAVQKAWKGGSRENASRCAIAWTGRKFLFLAISMAVGKPNGWRSSILADYFLSLYVSHWTVRDVIPALMTSTTYAKMLEPYILSALLYAAVLTAAITTAQKHSFGTRVKKLLVKYENEGRDSCDPKV